MKINIIKGVVIALLISRTGLVAAAATFDASAKKEITVWFMNNSAWHKGSISLEDEKGDIEEDYTIKPATESGYAQKLGEIRPNWTVSYVIDGTLFAYRHTYTYDDIAKLNSPRVLITFEQNAYRKLNVSLSSYNGPEFGWSDLTEDVNHDVEADAFDVPDMFDNVPPKHYLMK